MVVAKAILNQDRVRIAENFQQTISGNSFVYLLAANSMNTGWYSISEAKIEQSKFKIISGMKFTKTNNNLNF